MHIYYIHRVFNIIAKEKRRVYKNFQKFTSWKLGSWKPIRPNALLGSPGRLKIGQKTTKVSRRSLGDGGGQVTRIPKRTANLVFGENDARFVVMMSLLQRSLNKRCLKKKHLMLCLNHFFSNDSKIICVRVWLCVCVIKCVFLFEEGGRQFVWMRDSQC